MEERSGRAWLLWVIPPLVALCGAAIVCGLVGMMALSQPGTTLSPPGARETALPEEVTLPTPSPVPSLTPIPPSLPLLPTSVPEPTPSPTPVPKPTLTLRPTPSPTCPPVSGPFAALWEKYRDRLGCAINSAHTSWMAQEHFEGGEMFWREDNDHIAVLYRTGSWTLYRDIWNEGDPEYSCPDIAPTQSPPTPRRGFGKIWCTYSTVRQSLGWATDYERGFHGTVQDFAHGTVLRTDTGKTYVMVEGGEWWSE